MTDKIKRGDLKPDWSATLYDGDTAVDLTAATAVKLLGVLPDNTVITRTLVGPFGVDGVVTMPWQTGDTAVAGDFLAEIEVMWPGSKPQTFPPDDYLVTRIVQDIG